MMNFKGTSIAITIQFSLHYMMSARGDEDEFVETSSAR
jgi:hypothetical protein